LHHSHSIVYTIAIATAITTTALATAVITSITTATITTALPLLQKKQGKALPAPTLQFLQSI
jgi:hypothetical protein